MASKSGRKVITSPTTVRVKNFRQISDKLGVISYTNEQHERIDDLYNIEDAAVMDVLNHADAGKTVDAVVAPDGADTDQHPECTGASFVEGETVASEAGQSAQ